MAMVGDKSQALSTGVIPCPASTRLLKSMAESQEGQGYRRLLGSLSIMPSFLYASAPTNLVVTLTGNEVNEDL
ncbi:hypothetical protein D9758_008248 [Tetrapyrgos nigripes]|uniref:Uncharacterized protein n=1 Tax=Tetrapyrgos nigripes TaxID=182062 RepID=A0A8H5LGT9_9AGAR|nr:hypothetical protein D9758_008248 [Tetrapyrgos nigripes]